MDNVSQSKKLGVVIFGQHFCDQLEHIPIKKRISLRDSALYQPTPSAKVLDQKVVSPTLSKQPSVNLMTSQLDVNRSGVAVLSSEKADCPPDFSCTERHADSTLSDRTYTLDNANKVPSNEAVPPYTDTTSPSVSSFASDAKDDGLGTKGAEHVKNLTSDITGDSYHGCKSSIRPDPPCNDHEAVQSVTQEVRILWDLNVGMDAWEKPTDQNVESQSNVTTFEFKSGTRLDISEDFKVKAETMMPENNAENDTQPTYTSVSSGSMCEHKHIIPGSTYSLVCESVSKDQQIVAGTCSDKTLPETKPFQETESSNISCNHKLSFKTDEHLTPILSESANKSSTDDPKGDSGSSFETTIYCEESTDLQNCENQNIATTCESSGGDNGSSKKKTTMKAGQLEVAFLDSSDQCVDLLQGRAYVNDGNHLETLSENVKAAAAVHHPPDGMTKTPPDNVGVSMENQILGGFQEERDTSIVEPLGVTGQRNEDATVFKQVVNIDQYCEGQTEQDYEDGELRDLDMHCWNETETEMGETECLDYEPVDESSTSVSVVGKDEDQLKRKKHRSFKTPKNQLVAKDGTNSDKKMISGLCSEGYFGTHSSKRQLERKLSGWDQLPKDDHTSSDKVQEAHRVSSRILSSKLQGCIDIPTLSEDAEEKKTVFERRIRPKDMDNSYTRESGYGSDEFSGKRRSTPYRNRVEGWDSERRSSVNYHDIYDNRSGTRPLIMSSKGRDRFRSRSPSVRSEAYDPHINYSRYSRGRYGRHGEGSGRFFRGARNRYRGSLTDDRGESEFHVRQQFMRERSFSPRAITHFSENFNRSRSRSRTRTPPMWLPRYERMGSRGLHRSTEFRTEDRVKGTRMLFWKPSFTSDVELQYASPPRGRFIPHNKPRWSDDDGFDMEGPRDRSTVRRLCNKEKFNASCSHRRFNSSDDYRTMGHRGRMRETASPDRVRGYISVSDRRKREYSIEAGHRKRFYKDGFARQYQHDAEDNTEAQKCPLKVDFLEDGETRIGNMCKKQNMGN